MLEHADIQILKGQIIHTHTHTHTHLLLGVRPCMLAPHLQTKPTYTSMARCQVCLGKNKHAHMAMCQVLKETLNPIVLHQTCTHTYTHTLPDYRTSEASLALQRKCHTHLNSQSLLGTFSLIVITKHIHTSLLLYSHTPVFTQGKCQVLIFLLHYSHYSI